LATVKKKYFFRLLTVDLIGSQKLEEIQYYEIT